jgi:hypothetical protein
MQLICRPVFGDLYVIYYFLRIPESGPAATLVAMMGCRKSEIESVLLYNHTNLCCCQAVVVELWLVQVEP